MKIQTITFYGCMLATLLSSSVCFSDSRISEEDVTGVWANQFASLNFYGEPDFKAIYKYSGEGSYSVCEGNWNIKSNKVSLRCSGMSSTSHESDKLEKNDLYEFIPPRILRDKHGNVYYKQ